MPQLTFERLEIKYRLTEEQQARLAVVMAPHMVPDEHGPSTVCNVYYDTPSSLLIRRSLEKPVYKEKVRIRGYGVLGPSDPVFLELKKKCGGVVYKRRATMSAERAEAFLSAQGDPQGQIERELDFSVRRYGALVPAAFIAYDREAFYASGDREFRMTFDRRVRYRTDALTLSRSDSGRQILPDGMVLLEVKATGAMPLWLSQFLSSEGLFKTSFSKYGLVYETILSERPVAHEEPGEGARSPSHARHLQRAPHPGRALAIPQFRPHQTPDHVGPAVA